MAEHMRVGRHVDHARHVRLDQHLHQQVGQQERTYRGEQESSCRKTELQNREIEATMPKTCIHIEVISTCMSPLCGRGCGFLLGTSLSTGVWLFLQMYDYIQTCVLSMLKSHDQSQSPSRISKLLNVSLL